jgi:hypothetical protein
VQRPDPVRYYDATVPVRIFGRDSLNQKMRAAGYQLVEQFGSSPLYDFELCGMIFMRAP